MLHRACRDRYVSEPFGPRLPLLAASAIAFGAVTLAGLGLDSLLVHLFAAAGLGAFAAFLLALPFVTLSTFAANRRLTFRSAVGGYA